jgi:N-acetylglutamate synthase-like GNAT family acetyltransferase
MVRCESCGDSDEPTLIRRGVLKVIWRCGEDDFEAIWSIINDGAQAYRGVIPTDCWPGDSWSGPYMSHEKLQHEIGDGVVFWGYEDDEHLVGVMGIQNVQDVMLIRHAYVRTESQNRGIGAQLLEHLLKLATRPVLVGTWVDAAWAIRFYEKYGFQLVSTAEKNRLLRKYWTIPDRQIETSVVLVDAAWRNSRLMNLPFPEISDPKIS